MEGDDNEKVAEVIGDRKCPDCEAELIVRHGRYGKFIGCSAYPKCRFIEPLEKPEDTGVTCPSCKKKPMLKRKSRRGKIFYSCAAYPKCKYAVWDEPLNRPCPNCHWPMLTLKITKTKGSSLVCPQKECSFQETYTEPSAERVASVKKSVAKKSASKKRGA